MATISTKISWLTQSKSLDLCCCIHRREISVSRQLEMTLKPHLEKLVEAYLLGFPYAYANYNRGPADFFAELNLYKVVLETWKVELVRAAAWGISGYANLYGVFPSNGFDEFKKIYFMGRAIERRLIETNNVKIAKVHMFTMIGMMDACLESKGVKKAPLTVAMTKLIRLGLDEFDKELGRTGCYLIYKCSSTAPKHAIPHTRLTEQ
jgi:hypothetical protein